MSPLVAQLDAPVSGIALTAGLGGGVFRGADGGGSVEGITLLGQIDYQSGVHLLSLRGAIVAEVLGDGVGDIGLLYGRSRNGPRSHLSASIGLAWTYIEDCPGGLSSGSCEPRDAVGIPTAFTATWRPLGWLGLGAQVLGNVNRSSSFVALVLAAEVGRLR